MLLDKPLTAADIRELAAFLRSRATNQRRMDVETLHGFITTLIIGPDVVMPSEWMPYIWQGEAPEWETMAQAERIMSLVLGMNNDVSRSCFDGTFKPLLRNPGGRNAWTREAKRWSVGFLAGVDVRREAWQPFMRSEAAEMIMPVFVLQAPADDPDAADLVDTPAKRRRMVGRLAGSVLAMHAYWLERRKPAHAPEMGRILPFRKPATPGRNDPCPCGSGRKYKKCCGAS